MCPKQEQDIGLCTYLPWGDKRNTPGCLYFVCLGCLRL